MNVTFHKKALLFYAVIVEIAVILSLYICCPRSIFTLSGISDSSISCVSILNKNTGPSIDLTKTECKNFLEIANEVNFYFAGADPYKTMHNNTSYVVIYLSNNKKWSDGIWITEEGIAYYHSLKYRLDTNTLFEYLESLYNQHHAMDRFAFLIPNSEMTDNHMDSGTN